MPAIFVLADYLEASVRDTGFKQLQREHRLNFLKWGEYMKRANTAERKIEKLKRLILLVDPAVRLYLHKRAGGKVPLHVKLLGYPFMLATLVWSTKIRPHEEINQSICMMIHMGPWWCRLFAAMHPNVFLNLKHYWGGWRDQGQIGSSIYIHLCKKWEVSR